MPKTWKAVSKGWKSLPGGGYGQHMGVDETEVAAMPGRFTGKSTLQAVHDATVSGDHIETLGVGGK